MGFADGLGVTDQIAVALIDVVAPDPVPATPQPAPPETSPTEQAAEATIEQTGSGPPPRAD